MISGFKSYWFEKWTTVVSWKDLDQKKGSFEKSKVAVPLKIENTRKYKHILHKYFSQIKLSWLRWLL